MTISVIICTHNPRKDYLSRVLQALREQTLPNEGWELLLIDNASKESVSLGFDISWHPSGRHVREDQVGLTSARLRGISEAKGRLLVFVDDDNVLSPDWLVETLRISAEYPFLGCWGGSCIAEFEEPPDSRYQTLIPFLAIRDVNAVVWSNRNPESVPNGAGLCIRAEIADHYSSQLASTDFRTSLDRKGGNLMGGGDLDLAMTSYSMGLGTGVFPSLALRHLIPKGRLDPGYLFRICKFSMLSFFLVRFIHLGEIPSRPGRFQRMKISIRRIFGLRYDPCQDALLRGQLLAVEMIESYKSSGYFQRLD